MTQIVPVVAIRCTCTTHHADAPPPHSRPRFTWNLNELSGALGDLGTFLPHIVAAIAVIGMTPVGVLVSFGLYYLAAGAYFGVPVGVQPMKAVSAAILIQAMTPGEVAGAGLVLGGVFLLV